MAGLGEREKTRQMGVRGVGGGRVGSGGELPKWGEPRWGRQAKPGGFDNSNLPRFCGRSFIAGFVIDVENFGAFASPLVG